MRIAVDAMGGDHAPLAAVEGACLAAAEGLSVVLVGDRGRLEPLLEELGGPHGVEIEHADEVVGMADSPLAVRQKRRSSIRVAARLVKQGRARAVVSAGNTGAAMIAAKTVIGSIPGLGQFL